MSRAEKNGAPARVRIEYAYDAESRNWHFAVPALGIVGGGDQSEKDLLDHARSAIQFALTDQEVPDDAPGIRHFSVSISAA